MSTLESFRTPVGSVLYRRILEGDEAELNKRGDACDGSGCSGVCQAKAVATWQDECKRRVIDCQEAETRKYSVARQRLVAIMVVAKHVYTRGLLQWRDKQSECASK